MMMDRFKPNPYTGNPMYYKDNPEAVKKRDAQRMYVNGKEISKKHPLHKPGRYKSLDDAWTHRQINDSPEGEVYIIVNEAWPDWVKVGKASIAEDRLNGYQTSSPFRDYTLIATLSTDNKHDKEKEMHKVFSHFAEDRKGEWFKISRVNAIRIFNIHAKNELSKELEEDGLTEGSR